MGKKSDCTAIKESKGRDAAPLHQGRMAMETGICISPKHICQINAFFPSIQHLSLDQQTPPYFECLLHMFAAE